MKASLRSALLLPKAAIVDPELTHDLPASLTASTDSTPSPIDRAALPIGPIL